MKVFFTALLVAFSAAVWAQSGCTDAAACNYDVSAVTDDGSCLMPDPNCGCAGITMPTAEQTLTGYWSIAGSTVSGPDCEPLGEWQPTQLVYHFVSPGVVDVYGNDPVDITQLGFQYQTTVSFSSDCRMETGDFWFFELSESGDYLFEYNMAPGYCLLMVPYVPGCTNPIAANYDATATWDDQTCNIIYGCTWEDACNYDPDAAINDGSCSYPANPAEDCDGNCIGQPIDLVAMESFIWEFTLDADCDGPQPVTEYNSWTYFNDEVPMPGYPGDYYAPSYELACNEFSPNSGIVISIDGCQITWGGRKVFLNNDGILENIPTETECYQFTPSPLGCMDESASNYDPSAIYDLNLCEYSGCTDPSACNYFALATIDDGSCLSAGCTNAYACNFDASASCDNGTCEFDSCRGCTYPLALNYDAAALFDDGSCLIADSTCSRDLNNDGEVGTGDLLEVLAEFGSTCP